MASAAKHAKPDFCNVLHEELKCFICENGVIVGKHRWYKCMQGHMVCQDCKEVKGMKECSCNKPFVQGGHCKMTESLLNVDKMQFKCENLSRGCGVELEKESMIFHQTECIFRLVKCPGKDCKFEVSVLFHELIEHMKMKKESPVLKMRFREKMAVGSFLKRPVMIEVGSKTFLSCMTSNGSYGRCVTNYGSYPSMVHQWIYFVGSPQEAKHYSYTLEYQNEEGTTKNTFVSQVMSIDEPVDSIIRNGNCLNIFVEQFFSKFTRQGEENRYVFKPTVTIRNLKEEAKDENVESGISDNDE